MGTTSLEIVEDRSETCDEIKEHDVSNLLDPTTDARQVLAHKKKPRATALPVHAGTLHHSDNGAEPCNGDLMVKARCVRATPGARWGGPGLDLDTARRGVRR